MPSSISLFMFIAGVVCVLAGTNESRTDKARAMSFYLYGMIAFVIGIISATQVEW